MWNRRRSDHRDEQPIEADAPTGAAPAQAAPEWFSPPTAPKPLFSSPAPALFASAPDAEVKNFPITAPPAPAASDACSAAPVIELRDHTTHPYEELFELSDEVEEDELILFAEPVREQAAPVKATPLFVTNGDHGAAERPAIDMAIGGVDPANQTGRTLPTNLRHALAAATNPTHRLPHLREELSPAPVPADAPVARISIDILGTPEQPLAKIIAEALLRQQFVVQGNALVRAGGSVEICEALQTSGLVLVLRNMAPRPVRQTVMSAMIDQGYVLGSSSAADCVLRHDDRTLVRLTEI